MINLNELFSSILDNTNKVIIHNTPTTENTFLMKDKCVKISVNKNIPPAIITNIYNLVIFEGQWFWVVCFFGISIYSFSIIILKDYDYMRDKQKDSSAIKKWRSNLYGKEKTS